MNIQKYGLRLALPILFGLSFFSSTHASGSSTSHSQTHQNISQHTQVAYYTGYCTQRRVCSNRCVSYSGKRTNCYYNRRGNRVCQTAPGGYCLRWSTVCRNVCVSTYPSSYSRDWRWRHRWGW